MFYGAQESIFNHFLFKMEKKYCYWPQTLFENFMYKASFSFIFLKTRTKQKQ